MSSAHFFYLECFPLITGRLPVQWSNKIIKITQVVLILFSAGIFLSPLRPQTADHRDTRFVHLPLNMGTQSEQMDMGMSQAMYVRPRIINCGHESGHACWNMMGHVSFFFEG